MQEFQMNDKFWKMMAEASPSALVLVDKEGKILYTNKNTEVMFLYTKEEMFGKTIELLIPERYRGYHTSYRNNFFQNLENRPMGAGRHLFAMRKDKSELEVEIGLSYMKFEEQPYVLVSLVNVTERETAARQLRDSRNRLKNAQSIAKMGNWELNVTQNSLHWSDEIFRIFECEPNEFKATYQAFLSFVHPDDRDAVDTAYMNSLITKEPYEIIHRVVTKNGNLKYVREKCTTEYDTDGKPLRSEGVVLDITELKEKELALREQKLILNETNNLAKVGGWSLYLATNQLKWTPQVYEIHELPNDFNPTVQQALEFYDTESKPVIVNALNQAIHQGKPFELELSILTAKQNQKFVRVIGRILYDDQNKPEYVYGAFKDITAFKLKELELKRVSQKYKQLFDFMPIGISLANKNGELVEHNRAAEKLLGIESTELEGKKIDSEFWRLVRRDGSLMPQHEFASVRALEEQRLIENIEMGIEKGNNEITWLNVSALPNASEEGVIISFTDITDKIKRETELQELNATKDKLFSIIAHDLKNPFSSLMGFSELLIRHANTYSPEKISEFGKIMFNSSQRAYDLLENLLEWSRIQTGKMIPVPIRLKPSELMYEVFSACESLAINKEIDIQLNVLTNEEFMADREMITTVLRNLLTNAIKFTENRGIIVMQAERQEQYIKFTVIDNGIGIEPQFLSKLFKIDGKLSKPGTNGERGTGLGVILCKEFVEKNGGQIGVESELGKGSSFFFSIPLVRNI